MKGLRVAICTALVLGLGVLCGNARCEQQRCHIGVRLDLVGIDPLLRKHLRLSKDEGIRIRNVVVGSPADKAQLERDDIIVKFDGKPVNNYEQLAEAVQKAGAGKEVELEVIHLGQRKKVKVRLEPVPDEIEWKYPPEPELVERWVPGRLFRLRPEEKKWVEILPGNRPKGGLHDVGKLFKEVHVYHYDDKETYTITIEGNPDAPQSTITVETDETTYRTTVGEIGRLPEKYRKAAEDALKRARKSERRVRVKPFSMPRPDIWEKFKPPQLPEFREQFEKLEPPQMMWDHRCQPPHEQSKEILERIEKQIQELQKRIEKLEKRSSDKLKDSQDKKEQTKQQTDGTTSATKV